MEDDAGGDGNIQGVFRAIHRDLDSSVAERHDLVWQPHELVAEDHGDRRVVGRDSVRCNCTMGDLGGVTTVAALAEGNDGGTDVRDHLEGDNTIGSECGLRDLSARRCRCVAREHETLDEHRVRRTEDRSNVVKAADIVEDSNNGMTGNGRDLGCCEPKRDKLVVRTFLHTANIVLCRAMNRRHFLAGLATGLLWRPVTSFSALLAEGTWEMYVLGDWGAGGSLQRQVAEGMRSLARTSGMPNIILSTGDNIYPSGVVSTTDPQWRTKYEEVYTGLDVPWWVILGNHDHRGNVDAQVAYGSVNPRWNMPGRTWRQEFSVDPVTKVVLTALDTTPLLQKKEGWKEQLDGLERSLAAAPGARHIVAGHHPLRSYGHYGDNDFLVRNVKPILDRFSVMLYCSGHDHDLQAIRNPADGFACLVSGGGGGTRPTKRGPHTKAMHDGGGFASVRLTSRTTTVRLHDRTGATVGEITL